MNICLHIKNGDELVFQQVFEEYHAKLYFYILSKTKSEYYAEEVVQIAFVKLWQYRESLNEDLPVSVQLFRIAKTSLIDLLRKQETINAIAQQQATPSSIWQMREIAQDAISNKELHYQIAKALNKLPPMCRRVFEMSRMDGMSYKEIAHHLCISPKTVEHHISKALRQLRTELHTPKLLIAASLIIF